MRQSFSLVPFSLILVCLALPVQARQYEARYDQATWQVTRSAARCEAVHTIPHYGRALFIRESGRELIMRIEVFDALNEEGIATLSSTAPPWKADANERDLGKVVYRKGPSPFRLPSPQAHRVMYELEAGRMPRLWYGAGEGGEVTVVLSPIRFLNAIRGFRECIEALAPVVVQPLALERPQEQPPAQKQRGSKKDDKALKTRLKYRILSGSGSEVITIRVPEEEKP